MTDVSGDIAKTYTYDAYGNLLTPQAPNPHGFSTKEFSAKSGLIYFGARYYDPRTGRWITKDPSIIPSGPVEIFTPSNGSFFPSSSTFIDYNPDTFHFYLYSSNSPINFIDWWGWAKLYSRRIALGPFRHYYIKFDDETTWGVYPERRGWEFIGKTSWNDAFDKGGDSVDINAAEYFIFTFSLKVLDLLL